MKSKYEEKIMLYIPLGINTRIDYFTGFGKKELAEAMAGIVLGILLSILGFLITGQQLTIVIINIFFIGGSILATTKGSTNQSVIDIISDSIKFNNERKSYPYRQIKEWE